MQGHLVFVYDTLMRGEGGHHPVAHCRIERAARTPPRYELIDVGGYPGLLYGGTKAVYGQFFTLDEPPPPR